jgi:lipoprotein NlpD
MNQNPSRVFLLPNMARHRWAGQMAACFAMSLLAACASKSVAPIVDKSPGPGSRPPPVSTASTSQTPAIAASVPSASARIPADPRSPTYTVQKGDTLFRIALETGQAWRDLAAWNNLEDANKIEIGQVLRVLPPEGVTPAQAVPVKPGSVDTKLVVTAPPSPPVAVATPGIAVKPPEATGTDDEGISFLWPAKGSVVDTFNETRNKGVDIAGKAGDPVVAAADGRVVYAGSSLRGYGNLIIVKHNNTYLTAYAHNQTLIVKEGQVVKKGQQIAEMGSSDSDRVKLHFEVRRQGRPIDPLKMLPDKP